MLTPARWRVGRLLFSPARQDRLAGGDGSATGGSPLRVVGSGVRRVGWFRVGRGRVPLGPGSRSLVLTEVSDIEQEAQEGSVRAAPIPPDPGRFGGLGRTVRPRLGASRRDWSLRHGQRRAPGGAQRVRCGFSGSQPRRPAGEAAAGLRLHELGTGALRGGRERPPGMAGRALPPQGGRCRDMGTGRRCWRTGCGRCAGASSPRSDARPRRRRRRTTRRSPSPDARVPAARDDQDARLRQRQAARTLRAGLARGTWKVSTPGDHSLRLERR